MRLLVLLLLIITANIASAEDLNFKIKLKTPEEVSRNYLYEQTQYNRWDNVEGAVNLQLIGIHDIIVRQSRQRVKGQANDVLRSRYDKGAMTWSQYENQLEYINTDEPSHGHWWARPWYYSLTPENGGAPEKPIAKTIGWSIEIPDTFPLLGWLKQQFESFGDIWIDNTQDFDDIDNQNRIDSRFVARDRIERKDDKINYDRLERSPHPDVGVIKEVRVRQYQWYEGVSYHFRFRPSIKFRPTQGETISELSLRFIIELYHNKKHFGNVICFIQYNIPRQQTYLSAALVLINW